MVELYCKVAVRPPPRRGLRHAAAAADAAAPAPREQCWRPAAVCGSVGVQSQDYLSASDFFVLCLSQNNRAWQGTYGRRYDTLRESALHEHDCAQIERAPLILPINPPILVNMKKKRTGSA